MALWSQSYQNQNIYVLPPNILAIEPSELLYSHSVWDGLYTPQLLEDQVKAGTFSEFVPMLGFFSVSFLLLSY